MQTFCQWLWYLLIWYWMIVAKLWNNVIQLVYYNIWERKRWFFIISQCSWLCVTNWSYLIQTINGLTTLFKASQYHDSDFATFLWLKRYGRQADYPNRVCWVDVCGGQSYQPLCSCWAEPFSASQQARLSWTPSDPVVCANHLLITG